MYRCGPLPGGGIGPLYSTIGGVVVGEVKREAKLALVEGLEEEEEEEVRFA